MDASADVPTYRKAPAVDRNLANARLLVQRLDAERAVQLSGSAPLIWDLLDTHNTVDQVVDQLAERFSDTRETIEAGVRAALDSFIDQRLVIAE